MLQLFVNGIIVGSIIVLGGVGLTLTYGILKFANFAHGDVMTVGAYLGLAFIMLGLPLPVAIIPAMAMTALLGILIDKLLYSRLRNRPPTTLLIASVGVALGLRNLVHIIWGPRMRYYSTDIQMAMRLPFGVRIKPDEILIVFLSVLLIVLLHLFLKKTRTGKAMRAVADNMELAKVVGIDTQWIIGWTWGLGCALAAAAGIFLGLEVQLRPTMGWEILLSIFAAVILGGIGKPYGAMAGGLIIGISQAMSTAVLPPAYKPAVSFTILVLVLLIKPSGIFGRERRRA